MTIKNIIVIFFSLLISSTLGFASDPALPSFLIIGAQKSGTTTLYDILRQHPNVVNRPGEVHFFDVNFYLGVEWYAKQYPKARKMDAIRGDKSPYYLFYPFAAERAFATLPEAKIIILLRNPVDRAYSQYWMNKRKNIEPLSFEEAIEVEAERLAEEMAELEKSEPIDGTGNHRKYSYLSRGLYAEQIQRWLDYFPKEQVMVISSDDLRKDIQKVTKEVLTFLELPTYNHFNWNRGITHSYPPMDPILRETLSDYFRPYNAQLEELLGRKFNWE
ncbi:MAG: sulfotransferase domain-containing protein [Parachlamydiaceae bacterium]